MFAAFRVDQKDIRVAGGAVLQGGDMLVIRAEAVVAPAAPRQFG